VPTLKNLPRPFEKVPCKGGFYTPSLPHARSQQTRALYFQGGPGRRVYAQHSLTAARSQQRQRGLKESPLLSSEGQWWCLFPVLFLGLYDRAIDQSARLPTSQSPQSIQSPLVRHHDRSRLAQGEGAGKLVAPRVFSRCPPPLFSCYFLLAEFSPGVFAPPQSKEQHPLSLSPPATTTRRQMSVVAPEK
jgi:hypothetical protein